MEKGPYVESTMINGVTVSYWQGNGTLMPQGPRVAPHDINEFFIDHRKNKGEASPETIRTNTRNTQETVEVGATQQKIQSLMAYIAEWGRKHMELDSLQWKKRESKTQYSTKE